jgi:hypothetical protein
MPHTSSEQRSPGLTHVPQLALQQTLPGAHCVAPHITPGGAAAALGASDADALADALAALAALAAPAAALASRSPSTSLGGSTRTALGGGGAGGAASLTLAVGAGDRTFEVDTEKLPPVADEVERVEGAGADSAATMSGPRRRSSPALMSPKNGPTERRAVTNATATLARHSATIQRTGANQRRRRQFPSELVAMVRVRCCKSRTSGTLLATCRQHAVRLRTRVGHDDRSRRRARRTRAE